jgi:pimeloyl-ACP methyl ester carboxylesterase
MTGLILVAVLLVLVAGLAYQWLGTRRDRRLVPPPGALLVVGGRRMHVFTVGVGAPPVVFESGIAASSLNWTAVQREVSRSTSASTYDRAGYGWSDPVPGAVDASTACERLRATLSAAGLAPPYVLVGHSFASYILQLYACRHPGEIAGMVFVDPITHEDWRAPGPGRRRTLQGGVLFSRIGAVVAASGLLRLLLSRLEAGAPGAGRAVLRSFGSAATAAVTGIVGQVGKMPREVWPAIRAHWSRPTGFVTMARYFATLPESARQLEVELEAAPPWLFPLIVLTGERSESEVERHRRLAARSRRGTHVVVAGTGHWIHLDAPEAVVGAIGEVLARARAEAPGP